MNLFNIKVDKGFTIIELMLAMAFLSALLLAIAMTVIQISNIYNRGLTFTNVNQAGSMLVSELQRSISGSPQFDISGSGSDARYINKTWGGRLCVGQYSYIWNNGNAIYSKNPNLYIYSDPSKTDTINFVKTIDPNASYCTEPTSKIDSSGAIELLNKGQNDLAIQSFSINSEPSAYDSTTGQRLYSISFYIGTNDQTTLESGSEACLSGNDVKSDPTYCAVNRFDIVARAGTGNVAK